MKKKKNEKISAKCFILNENKIDRDDEWDNKKWDKSHNLSLLMEILLRILFQNFLFRSYNYRLYYIKTFKLKELFRENGIILHIKKYGIE